MQVDDFGYSNHLKPTQFSNSELEASGLGGPCNRSLKVSPSFQGQLTSLQTKFEDPTSHGLPRKGEIWTYSELFNEVANHDHWFQLFSHSPNELTNPQLASNDIKCIN